ncbi:MAG: glycosyltransferase involved in cell wall biosynthesis [Oceanicoccus sp.]|jgi:glycosyltransferase involved in cell wall biosynthesis
MCTLGRSEEPKKLLSSLCQQSYKNFQLIIVDQNTDDRIDKLCEDFQQQLNIKLLKTSPGLSKARNTAIPFIDGDVISFPDDDCWYPSSLLNDVAQFYTQQAPYNGLCIQRADNELDRPKKVSKFELSKYNIWGKVPSITLFISKQALCEAGNFDEQLGIGSGTPWGAGEDTDLVLRSMSCGHKWLKTNTMQVFHPPSTHKANNTNKLRTQTYARGLGRVLAKHQLPLWMIISSFGMSALRITASLICLKSDTARWHQQALIGKWQGWQSMRKQ